MTTSEKVAYLKGLAEGMGVDENAGQGKLFKVIIDVLEDLALDVADTREALTELADGVEAINDDLEDLEEAFYDAPWVGEDDDFDDFEDYDEDDEDEDGDYDDEDDGFVYYSVKCPGCGTELHLEESFLDLDAFECPDCGELIDITAQNFAEEN